MKYDQIQEIHDSFINGQKRQMVEMIDEYGNYDFWSDYTVFLTEYYSEIGNAFDTLSGVVIAYNRIKNR